METPASQPCGGTLWRTRTIRGKTFSFPLQTFLYQELKAWLGRLLSRDGLEEMMDAAATRLMEPPKAVMEDIWDAPVLRELLKDGRPFVLGPPEEGRYIFGLYVDSFNPYQSKEAKQTVSVTGIYLVCLNLPPHLRYLPENTLLVGVIPGPHKPSLEQLNHFLRPLVDELLVFWDTGVFFSRTAKYDCGRLVRAALVPLVCDLPAARQTAGFGGHGAKFFCSMCILTKVSINDIRYKTWVPRTCHQHRLDAEAWRDAPSVSARNAAFKLNSTRWSELLRLPYWNPITYTVIDSMHNHYLGLLKFHCRRLWGMNISATDARDSGSHLASPPPEEELSQGTRFLYSGGEHELAACSKQVLKHLCTMVGIVTSKEPREKLVKRLRTKQGISSIPAALSAPANESQDPTVDPGVASTGPPTVGQPLMRGAASPEKIAAAEITLASARSTNSLAKKYNIATLQVLCRRRGLLDTGGREVLANRLLQARQGLTAIVAPARGGDVARQPSLGGRNSDIPPPLVEDFDMDTPVTGEAVVNSAKGPSSAILGRHTLSFIHEQLPLTELPSWINPVPRNVGTTARGKLSADQWHILCIVHLPIILIRKWAPQGDLFKRMLDNYMNLVTEVMMGSLLEMSAEAISTYETAAYDYLDGAQSLYDFQLTPNHHNSLHIPFFMRYFGPLHSIRTFFSERMNYLLQRQNTNLKFGELELTYMRHTCRASNLRALLANNAVRPHVMDIVSAYDHLQSEDRRGTRLRESVGLQSATDPSQDSRKQMTLDNSCMTALVSYLNQFAGEERFIDARALRRIPGTIQLLTRAFRVASVQINGVTFRSSRDAAKDSNILFAPDAENSSWAAGRIESIFSYSYRDRAQRVVEDTYVFVKQYQPLSPSDSKLDVFRAYPHGGGWLVYDRSGDGVVVPSSRVIAHFARTPMRVDGISSPCVHVLPLDKVKLVNNIPGWFAF
uniref:Zn(2)-C6 fungal-type domain-containing protein n=1 Tax=Ganoderma boninense TaxID=34458 RepID=A0A5K1K155_9APHY|nr:Zn(2)-C6 fungal-type domain-containing protein [Ganoderma boninense]